MCIQINTGPKNDYGQPSICKVVGGTYVKKRKVVVYFLLPAAKKWYLWVRGKTVRVRVPHRTHINGSFFFVCSPVFPKLILWFFFLPEFAFDRPLKWKRSWNFPLNLPNGVSISYHNLFFTVFVLTVSVASSVLLFRLSNFKSFGIIHTVAITNGFFIVKFPAQ